MLADEPVASLDPATSHSVMKYLEEINQRGRHHRPLQPPFPVPGAALRDPGDRAEGRADRLRRPADRDRRRSASARSTARTPSKWRSADGTSDLARPRASHRARGPVPEGRARLPHVLAQLLLPCSRGGAGYGWKVTQVDFVSSSSSLPKSQHIVTGLLTTRRRADADDGAPSSAPLPWSAARARRHAVTALTAPRTRAGLDPQPGNRRSR